MATDLERLVVRLEAQMRTFERELARGRQTANSQLSAIEKRFQQASKTISGSFGGLSRVLGAVGIGISVRELQQFADGFTQIQNSLKVAGLQGEELDRVYQRLFESAQKNAAPLESLGRLYGRVALVQKELKVSTEEMLLFTDRIALALRVSGQSAAQSSGALLQLSQALGSGVVRAEEFNSILEGALPIAQAAAAGILEAGGSVAKLRQLVIDGKVSSEAFFRGFQAGSKILEERAAGMELTIGQAFTKLQNSLIDAVGKIDKTTGVSAAAVTALDTLSSGVRSLAEEIERQKKPFTDFVETLKEIDRGISSVMRDVGRFTGLNRIGPALGLAPPGVAEQQQLDRVTNQLNSMVRDLENARQTAAETNRKLDQLWVSGMESAIQKLKEEKQKLEQAIQAFVAAPPGSQTATPAGPGGGSNKPISLADYPANAKRTNKLDTFERALFNSQKRIELLNTETRLIDADSAARERARLVVELETAAKAKNQAEGKKNIEVTKEQRVQIEAMADQMYRAAEAAEKARSPLLEFAREAGRLNDRYQDFALSGLRSFEDALVSIGDKTETVAEKFKKMTASILSDLSRLLIRQTITAPLAGFLGGMFTGGATGPNGAISDPNAWAGLVPGRAAGGPVAAGTPYVVGESGKELFVPRQDGVIIPNHAVKSSAVGGVTVSVPVSINADGADPSQLSRLTAEVTKLQRELPARVVHAVRQANQSNVKLN